MAQDHVQQLAQIRRRIDAGERGPALDALDALLRSHPRDDAIASYWCQIALRLKMGPQVAAFAARRRDDTANELLKIKWTAMAGDAHMLGGDFADAWRWFADALAMLAALAEHGRMPPPAPPPTQPAAPSPWSDMARVERRLWQVLAALKAADLQAFPMFGTLLGLVREGTPLPFDKDLDLGVWLEDYRATCRQLRAMGMQEAPLTPPYDNFCTFIDGETQLTFDLSAFRREPEQPRIVSGVWLYGKPPDHQRISLLPWFTLTSQSRPEGEIWWPDQPEAILTALYGDWRTPRPDWDSATAALNLCAPSLQYRCYAYARLNRLWLSGDIAKARRSLVPVLARLPDDAVLDRCRGALDQLLAWMAPT